MPDAACPWRQRITRMNKLELKDLLHAAKVQRDAALARRIDALAAGKEALVNDADRMIAECNELIIGIEKALEKLGE